MVEGMKAKKGGNRKGFEMAISTLIIIVLGMLVLLVLVLGFTMGWDNFWNTVTNIIPSSSVKSATASCINACNTDDSFDFCCIKRTVKFSGEKEEIVCTDTRLEVQCPSINCEGIICVVDIGSGED